MEKFEVNDLLSRKYICILASYILAIFYDCLSLAKPVGANETLSIDRVLGY